MRFLIKPLLIFILSVSLNPSQAQNQWPKQITYNGITIKIYQPEIKSLNGNDLRTWGAFFILEKEIPKWDLVMSLDQPEASMEADDNKPGSSGNYLTNPPIIIYKDKPKLNYA